MNECLEFKSSAVISFLTRTRSVCAQLIWGEAGARLFYINPTNLLFEKINRRRIGGARSRDHRCAGVSTTAGRRSREEDRAREAALPATLRIKFLQHGRQEESDEAETPSEALLRRRLLGLQRVYVQEQRRSVQMQYVRCQEGNVNAETSSCFPAGSPASHTAVCFTHTAQEREKGKDGEGQERERTDTEKEQPQENEAQVKKCGPEQRTTSGSDSGRSDGYHNRL